VQAAVAVSKSEFWLTIKILRGNKGASRGDGQPWTGRGGFAGTSLTPTDERGVVFLFRFGTEPK